MPEFAFFPNLRDFNASTLTREQYDARNSPDTVIPVTAAAGIAAHAISTNVLKRREIAVGKTEMEEKES